MAQFTCSSCGHEAHFSEFKVGSHSEMADEGDDLIEVDDCECPDCGSEDVYESA